MVARRQFACKARRGGSRAISRPKISPAAPLLRGSPTQRALPESSEYARERRLERLSHSLVPPPVPSIGLRPNSLRVRAGLGCLWAPGGSTRSAASTFQLGPRAQVFGHA